MSFAGATDPSAGDTAAGLTYSFDFDNDGVFDVTEPVPTADVPAGLLVDGPPDAAPSAAGWRTRTAGSPSPPRPSPSGTWPRRSSTLTTDAGTYREGDTVTLTGTIADPGALDSADGRDRLGRRVAGGHSRLRPGATTFAARAPVPEQPDRPDLASRYPVRVTVTDKDGGDGRGHPPGAGGQRPADGRHPRRCRRTTRPRSP